MYWDRFHYSPASFLGWALDAGWQPGVLPIGVVYTFQPAAALMAGSRPDLFAEDTNLTVSNARMFMTSDQGAPVLVASLNPGGASMASQLEHLRYLGSETRYAAIVGTAGAMVPGLHYGDVLVASSALRDDGISDRYLPPGPVVEGDGRFSATLHARLGAKQPTVRTWSVAVPYRQTEEEVERARSAGARVVEMEIATLFAVAKALDFAATAAVVVSDINRVAGWESDWTDTAEPTQRTVLDVIATMRELAEEPS